MKKLRQSNIELLRIISMLLVLMVHADFTSIGTPSRDLMLVSPGQFTFRVLVEFLSVLCVDIFVVISGWFSIRLSVRGLCNYLWQCLYFSAGIYAVILLCGMVSLSPGGILGIFYLDKGEWFVKAYLALMILAPVLNAFVDRASRKQMETVLIAFFIFQTIFSFRGAAEFIQAGYSTFSFIGLYCSRVTCASIAITSLHLISWVFSSVQFWQMLLYFQPMYISGPILPPAYA